MNEEEKEALEILKGLEFEEYDWYVKTDKIEGHANEVVSIVENSLNTIIKLIEKQQKEIENIKEYINSPEFLDWNLGFKLIDELEYRKDRINELLGE